MSQSHLDQDTQNTLAQFKVFLESYNKVTDKCFKDCAHDFTTRKVIESETNCSNKCVEKYLKVTTRINQRFQETMGQQGGGVVQDMMAKQ